MNTIWSLSKSARYTDRSENVLVVLALASVVQIALAFQAGHSLLPTATADAVPVMGTVLSTNAPVGSALVHAPVSAGLARPAARS